MNTSKTDRETNSSNFFFICIGNLVAIKTGKKSYYFFPVHRIVKLFTTCSIVHPYVSPCENSEFSVGNKKVVYLFSMYFITWITQTVRGNVRAKWNSCFEITGLIT